MHRHKDITNFLNNPRTIYIGGTMLPRKSVIETIPATKTHISQNNIKGPGYRKMNCSPLDDNNNQREPRFTAKMPVCPAEGRCDLSDHRCIWDWIKYNFRAHAGQFSKRNSKEKKIKRTYCKMNLTMQRKRSNVTLPIKMQAILIRQKKNWNIFIKKSFKVSSFVRGCDDVNTVKRVPNIF